MYQLELVNPDSAEAWFTGISVHLIGGDYDPVIYDSDSEDFNPTTEAGRIQLAIDAWEADTANHSRGGIILIRPNEINDQTNREGAHFENLIMVRPVFLQGIGPGGDLPADEETRGTQLNGGNFGAGVLCLDEDILFCDALATDKYRAKVVEKATALSSTATIANTALVEGSVLYVLSNREIHEDGPTGFGWGNEAWAGGIDGCLITGGVQENRGALNPAGGEVPEVVAVQGGGITVSLIVRMPRIAGKICNNKLTSLLRCCSFFARSFIATPSTFASPTMASGRIAEALVEASV